MRFLQAAAKVFFVLLFSVILVMPLDTAQAKKGKGKPQALKPGPEAALSFLRNQIGASGLVDSFVEDGADYSYTYDNALAAMAFISAGDMDSARTVLDAFLNIIPEPTGGFLHRYRAEDASPYYGILRAGHNAYLLQAMNMYYKETDDARYNYTAQGIADYLLSLQDVDGGIFGSSEVSWKSAENNLGALSAIHNFGITQNAPFYVEKAGEIRGFLVAECWDGTRFLTGKNDPMIVTDVQALGALVLGPDYSGGAYWIEGYTLNSQRYSGRKKITGFDMNTDRDTVWTEGTLQESMAFLVSGDVNKFGFYKSECEKLFQSSGALLQASNKGTTGFGDYFQAWQAVAPTAWYIYACNQDNVLELLDE